MTQNNNCTDDKVSVELIEKVPLTQSDDIQKFDIKEGGEVNVSEDNSCCNPCTYVLAGICYLLDVCGCC